MQQIKSKNLEALAQVMEQITNTLTSEGYLGGQPEFTIPNGTDRHGNELTVPVSGAVEWLTEMWSQVQKGGRFLISEVVEYPNDDNYHFSGESLWLESTVLNREGRVPALLVELISIRIPSDATGNFINATKEVVEKVYHFKMLDKVR